MTLVNDLKGICRKINGTLLTIGLSYPTVESTLEHNNNITEGYVLAFDGKKKSKIKDKFGKKLKTKKFSIKKLRKSFHKKSVDTIILNYDDSKKYMRFFIKDSIYINRGKLYIYGKKEEYVIEDIEKYYNRYDTKIVATEYEDNFLVEIDNSKAKNKWFKEKIYRIKDSFSYYINLIGDIMIG